MTGKAIAKDEDKEQGQLKLEVPSEVAFLEFVVDTATKSSVVEFKEKNKYLTLKDHRKNDPGWTISVSAEDLVFEDERISVSNLGIFPKDFSVNGGSKEGVVLGEEQYFTDGQQLMVASASPGFGRGKFEFYLDLILEIPANTAAGDYQTKLIFTVQ
jgi:hypothetical protein